jgi:CBS domain-containing protein
MKQIMTDAPAHNSPSQPPAATATVADVMRPPLTMAGQYDHVAAATYLMKHTGTTALMVANTQTGQPAGIITQADITRAIADGTDPNNIRIYAAMITRPAVTTTTSLRDAATIMTASHLRHLPVAGDAGLLGVIDITDLCHALTGTGQRMTATRSQIRTEQPAPAVMRQTFARPIMPDLRGAARPTPGNYERAYRRRLRARLFGPACHVVSVPTVRFPRQNGVGGPHICAGPPFAGNLAHSREEICGNGRRDGVDRQLAAGRGPRRCISVRGEPLTGDDLHVDRGCELVGVLQAAPRRPTKDRVGHGARLSPDRRTRDGSRPPLRSNMGSGTTATVRSRAICCAMRDVLNLGTYWAQRAAEGRPRPVPAGRVIAIDHILGIRVAASDDQVRVQMRTSTPAWATMHRVTRRCSSVGRAAVL